MSGVEAIGDRTEGGAKPAAARMSRERTLLVLSVMRVLPETDVVPFMLTGPVSVDATTPRTCARSAMAVVATW